MKSKQQKILIGFIIFIILLGVVAFIFVKSKDNGKTTTHNDIVYTINKVERITENEYNVASEGKEFLLFNVTITNNSKKEYQYSALDWQLIKKDEKYNVYGIDPENNLDGGTLNPEESITGTFAYEIPFKSKGFKLIYSTISNPDKKLFEFNISG